MSEIEDQIDVVQFVHLKHRLFRNKLSEDIEDFTKNVIMDIVEDLEENKNTWRKKWM